MNAISSTTLESIHKAAKAEFLEKGFQSASLRRIVKSVGMTTGAFYGYYKSKEELFEALVGEHYRFMIRRFKEAQSEFAALPPALQPENLSSISGSGSRTFCSVQKPLWFTSISNQDFINLLWLIVK